MIVITYWESKHVEACGPWMSRVHEHWFLGNIVGKVKHTKRDTTQLLI